MYKRQLETLLSTYNDGQAVQAAALIGKSVLVAGSGLVLADGQASAGVSLAEPADNVETLLVLMSAEAKVRKAKHGRY